MDGLTSSERCSTADSYSPLSFRVTRSSCHCFSFSMSFESGSKSRGEAEDRSGGLRSFAIARYSMLRHEITFPDSVGAYVLNSRFEGGATARFSDVDLIAGPKRSERSYLSTKYRENWSSGSLKFTCPTPMFDRIVFQS